MARLHPDRYKNYRNARTKLLKTPNVPWSRDKNSFLRRNLEQDQARMVRTLLLTADWVKEEEMTGYGTRVYGRGARRPEETLKCGTLKGRGNVNHTDYFTSLLIKAPNANCSLFSNHTRTFLTVIFLYVDWKKCPDLPVYIQSPATQISSSP